MLIRISAVTVYINLPVHDIERARDFFGAVGFSFDERFCTDDALAMTVNDSCHAMLLDRARCASFSPRPVADPHDTAQVLTDLQLESRQAVDALIDLAVANGGKDVREPIDYGFKYGRAFADPDAHIWEPFWFSPEAVG
ncbi:MAG: hypothetical protein OXN89_03150 [Bryobacterales bacterium]|nr:hypothetical protein [Bryobacterales bacterium]